MKTVPAENYFHLFENSTIQDYLDNILDTCIKDETSVSECVYIPSESIKYSYHVGLHVELPWKVFCVPDYDISSRFDVNFSGVSDNKLEKLLIITNGVKGEQLLGIGKETLQNVLNRFHKDNMSKFREGKPDAYISYVVDDESDFISIDYILE